MMKSYLSTALVVRQLSTAKAPELNHPEKGSNLGNLMEIKMNTKNVRVPSGRSTSIFGKLTAGFGTVAVAGLITAISLGTTRPVDAYSQHVSIACVTSCTQ
jgi:hypothetical protein